jgi:hypothetical protein
VKRASRSLAVSRGFVPSRLRLGRPCAHRDPPVAICQVVLEPPLVPLQPLAQQPHVAPVRAPQNVKGVADQRHRAEHAVERNITKHARDDAAIASARNRVTKQLKFGITFRRPNPSNAQ